jgi:small subunit ribosomal protein S29e
MGGKALLNSHPKKESGSKGARRCRVCANQCAIIRKYHLNMCRQCFRERALDIGFIKVSLFFIIIFITLFIIITTFIYMKT